MSSADLATVVIACPHCGTRYQVPHATLGAGGREVQCAQCGKSWHAEANVPPPAAIDPDTMFPADEAALDFAFEEEARAIAPPPPAHPPAEADPEHERTLAEIRAAIAPKPKKQPVNAMDAAAIAAGLGWTDSMMEWIAMLWPLRNSTRSNSRPMCDSACCLLCAWTSVTCPMRREPLGITMPSAVLIFWFVFRTT